MDDSDIRTLQQLARSIRAQVSTQQGLTQRLLEAAFANQIPWLHLSGNVYQFGWGIKSRLLDGTLTERTPAIAVRLARNKAAAAHVLRESGVPVPQHRSVASAEDAESYAATLGWPVVVKPLTLDGGRGVAAGLNTTAALRNAYERARLLSAHILVEKHVPGKDYRVIVLHGKVIGVWERIPGGVTGDGRRDINDLLRELNASPMRQPAARRRKQIALDNEAEELLLEQGLDVASVPAAGQFIRLRRTANIATGGSAEKTAPDRVHPDNNLICERAARVLRLDLAGVDLLMPDISRSWLEGGAAICEVNAQPQLSPEFPAIILRTLILDNGRIPVAIVIDDGGTTTWMQGVLSELADAGLHVGCVAEAGVTSGGKLVVADEVDVARATHFLLRDPQVQLVIVSLQHAAQLKNGFPVDRCDLLVLDGGRGFHGGHEAIARMLTAGLPQVVVNANSPLWEQWSAGEARTERIASTELRARVTQLLQEWTGRQ